MSNCYWWSGVASSCVLGSRDGGLGRLVVSSRRRHTRCAVGTGVQTWALPICGLRGRAAAPDEPPGAGHPAAGRLPHARPGLGPRPRARPRTGSGTGSGTGMTQPSPLLSVGGLTVRFRTREGVVHAVSEVGFELAEGRVLGILGEDRKSTRLNSSH